LKAFTYLLPQKSVALRRIRQNFEKNPIMDVSGKVGPETPCLAMRPREAAKALGISERLLWEWTGRGVVPHVRLGKAIL